MFSILRNGLCAPKAVRRSTLFATTLGSFARWRLEVKLVNALDRRVEPLLDYPGLGRQAWIDARSMAAASEAAH